MKIEFFKITQKRDRGVFLTCYHWDNVYYRFYFSKMAMEKFNLAPGDRFDIGVDRDTGNIILVLSESGEFKFIKSNSTVGFTSAFLGRSLGLKGKERFECAPVEGYDNYIQIVIPKEYKLNIP